MASALFDLAIYTLKVYEHAPLMDRTAMWNITRCEVLASDLGNQDGKTSFGQASFTPNLCNTDVA